MGIRILLVEDEPALADFVVRGLREEGFTVEHAGDGESGWHALRTADWVEADYQLVAMRGISHWIPEQAPRALAKAVLDRIGSVA